MKKKLFFLPLLAALVLAGCSKEESDAGGGNGSNGEQYLAISIVSNTSGGSRTRYDQGGNQYEDGTGAENTVTAVRLYFFSSTNQPLKIKKGAAGNFYDVPTENIQDTGNGKQEDTTEKVIKAFIMIDAGELLPKQVVAVINPPSDLTENNADNNNMSLDVLRNRVHDYATLAKQSSFVMVNSVYAKNQKILTTTTIENSHYKKSEEDAIEDPVVIYVERNVAKVRVSVSDDMPKEGSLYKVYQKEKDENGKETGNEFEYKIGEGENAKQVYVKFEGWDVTADLQYAWLSKRIFIAPTWADNLLGAGTFWNDPAHHRSYWAGVCNGGKNKNNENQYYPYNDATHFTNKKFDGSEHTYCNENAAKETSGFQATDVIVKGTLCDKDSKPLTITEYASFRTVDDENFTTLKRRYVAMMVNNTATISSIPYKKEIDLNGNATYTQLEADDLTFTPVSQVLENVSEVDNAAKAVEASGRCYVYACLTSDAEKYEWYSQISKDAAGKATVKEEDKIADPKTVINTYLKGLSHAKIWKTGQTYYYADIIHAPDKAGVVRNHIYDVKLTKIYGIGTPVYDESLTIIPEKPTSEDTYVAAKIDILSWRLMTQDVVFDWD